MHRDPPTQSAQPKTSHSDSAQPAWAEELEIIALRNATEFSLDSPAHSPSATTADALTAHHSLPQAEALSMTSVWQLESLAAADASFTAGNSSYAYRRVEHPNARALATKLSMLHAAQRAVVTAQGMSGIAAVALANLRPGARVWLSQELYGETSQLFAQCLLPWQVETHLFDPTDDDQLRELATSSVDMVVIETITNPRLRVADIARVSRATSAAGALLVVDNTFATYLMCQPLRLGADFVVESLGKQVNGHGDGMIGFVAGRDLKRMAGVQGIVKTFGMTSSPLDCYLTHRGLMSLAVRMERVCTNAQAVAECLSSLPRVTCVDFPGLTTNAGHHVARQQFSGGFGWMVTFHIDADRAGVEQLLQALLPEIRFVPSLGDVSTTVSHPLSTSHRDTPPETLAQLGITLGTIRVSCGIEPTQWLVDCFRRALA